MAASSSDMSTLQSLLSWEADDPGDNAILGRLKKLINAHLPAGWGDWKVRLLDKENLLGTELDPRDLNKVRFAIPTVGLARAFNPECTTLPERTYRNIKLKLLEWPLCVGLIIHPMSLAARVRGSAVQNELTIAAISDMKPLLKSREEANKELSGFDQSGDDLSIPSRFSSKRSEKMSRLDKLEQGHCELKGMMMEFIKKFQPQDYEECSNPEDDESVVTLASEEPAAPHIMPSPRPWVPPAAFSDDGDFNWAPSVIPAPKPHIAQQGAECQRLGDISFGQIRYADVQKRLHASPVFSPLKINFASESRPNKVTAGRNSCFTVSKKAGLDNKYGQIPKEPFSAHRIPRHKLGHIPQYEVTSQQENSFFNKDSKQRPSNSTVELAIGEKSVRQTEFCLLYDTPRKTSFKANTTGGQYIARKTAEQKVSHSDKGSSTMRVVATKPGRNIAYLQCQRDRFYHDGCFGQGLGSTDKRKTHQWTVGTTSAPVAHQQKRAVCSTSGVLCRHRLYKEQKSVSTIRQSNCNSLYKESGRDKIITANSSRFSITDSSSESTHRDLPTVYSRNIQRRCRQPIATEAPDGLAPFEKNLRTHISEVGNPRSGPVCYKHFKGSPSLCIAGCNGQRSPVHRCVQQEMGIQVSMGFSSSVPDTTSACPFESSERHLHTNCTTMGKSVLEIGPSGSSDRSAVSNPEPAPPFEGPVGTEQPFESSGCSFGGLEGTGWSILTKNWLEDDRRLLQRAWRSSSLKTYSAPWKTWLSRCRLLGLNPIKPDPSSVAQHLSFLYRERKLSPNTIKLHKSVIATFADPLHRVTISDSPVIKQIIKAIELSRPPAIKRQIWDVKQLITWLDSTPVQKDSIFQVSRHLAFLLLLASGRRIHDLTLLRIDDKSMSIDEASVTFWPVFGSKTDSRTHRQSGWKLSRVPKENLDPVRWVSFYLAVTESRLNTGEGRVNSLFITSRGKVSCASKAVIAGWLRTVFLELNINFSPGSIRAAVASSRRDNNVPIDTILKNGNWRSDHNVVKHYFKEIISIPSKDDSNNLSLVDDSFTAM